MPLSDLFKAARKPAPACIGTTVCTDLVLVEGLAFGLNILLYDEPAYTDLYFHEFQVTAVKDGVFRGITSMLNGNSPSCPLAEQINILAHLAELWQR